MQARNKYRTPLCAGIHHNISVFPVFPPFPPFAILSHRRAVCIKNLHGDICRWCPVILGFTPSAILEPLLAILNFVVAGNAAAPAMLFQLKNDINFSVKMAAQGKLYSLLF